MFVASFRFDGAQLQVSPQNVKDKFLSEVYSQGVTSSFLRREALFGVISPLVNPVVDLTVYHVISDSDSDDSFVDVPIDHQMEEFVNSLVRYN